MAFISKYLVQINRNDIIKNLRASRRNNISIEGINEIKVGNFIISKDQNGFIHAKIAVQRVYDDLSYNINEDFEIEVDKKEIHIGDDVNFTIFPDIKIISFTSKDSAKLFGMQALSKIIFGEEGKIFGLTFYPQKVLEAKKSGKFQNVWFNGVRCEGKIGYTGQFGTEIDEDNNFLSDPEKRDGIGIVFQSKSGKKFKIAIYKNGCLVWHTKIRDQYENLKMVKEVVLKFIPYSNCNEELTNINADQFISLNDYI